MTIDQLKQLAIDALEDLKAEDITVLDVKDKTTVTDWVIVATGSSSRHVKSIANNVLAAVKQAGKQPLGSEGEDDGEWVLGHKEFRYAVVPEVAGELVLPEIRLDWWDTVANHQRTAVLPEHRVNVLPSELSQSVGIQPPAASVMPDSLTGVPAVNTNTQDNAILWKVTTAVFALLWLLTLFFYFRRRPVITAVPGTNGSISLDEKDLLKQFQRACQTGDASSARKDLAQWIRHYAPKSMRGSMRDFGLACGEPALQAGIAELDVYGFADDSNGVWKGDVLWSAFKTWQRQVHSPRKPKVGSKPDLYNT